MVDAAAIAEVFPRAVELAERPLLRTAPAPLLRLSEAVHDAGLKVVLTGEGADELFGGYDIFREDKVRRFWARDPDSRLRPLLFARLNQWLPTHPSRTGAFVRGFYGQGLLAVDDPLYSHHLRFLNTARCLRLLRSEVLEAADRIGGTRERLLQGLPAGFDRFSPLAKAQCVEIATFFQGYLLHSQGDRMLMGNSIEGRFPFLDFRVAELAARLPDSMRLRGLQEKYALRQAVAAHLPPEILARSKVPYRAPIRDVFFGNRGAEYCLDLLRPARLAEAGLLDAGAVGKLVAKFEAAAAGGVSETDEMALVGSLSLMVLHDRLVASPSLAPSGMPTRIVVGDEVVSQARAFAEVG